MQPRLFFLMSPSQTFVWNHNYDERGTFKIYYIFVFGSNSFSVECYGHFYDSIKIAIFKTLRRLDKTLNFARTITRVSTHEHEHWEHCLCTQSLLKREFTLAVACSTSHRPANGEVLISECNVTWRTVKVERYCLPATMERNISCDSSGDLF